MENIKAILMFSWKLSVFLLGELITVLERTSLLITPSHAAKELMFRKQENQMTKIPDSVEEKESSQPATRKKQAFLRKIVFHNRDQKVKDVGG